MLLKVKLFDMAMKGDRATAIFLSKNRLGYRDRPKDAPDDKATEVRDLTAEEAAAVVGQLNEEY